MHEHSNDNRARLRVTFDAVAEAYDAARPTYPEQVFDDIIAWSGMATGGRILEIGCGTGQATMPFARRGYAMRCIELGANLAAVAQRKVAAYPDVVVDVGAFETYPLDAAAYDLVFAATAFHWIDPTVGYPRIAHALRPGGTVAIFGNAHVEAGDGGNFFEDVQRIYERLAPDLIPADHQPLRHPDAEPASDKVKIDASGLFSPAVVRRYHWTITYDARSYIAVLDTYSGHRSLPDDRREGLYDAIATLIRDGYDDTIIKGYLTMLTLGRTGDT